jgi:hypothetical protein
MATITIPDFEFSGFYYNELLESLVQWLRVDVPEITDESPEEPFIQLLRANALMGHLTNVLLDQVANERFLPTAQLRASVAAQLKLIDYTLAQATPASADLLVQLAQVFTASTLLVPALAKFATAAAPTQPAILFEALNALAIHRTDRVGWVLSYNKALDAYVDNTADAFDPGTNFLPTWGGVVGDALYIGHPDILWDTTRFLIAASATGVVRGVWEYFDGNFDDGEPDTVANDGLHLEFQLNGLLGSGDMTGTLVRVRSAITGAYETLPVTYSAGVNTVEASGFLGQSVPSLNPSDYVVGADWQLLPRQTDETLEFGDIGQKDVTYAIPQTVTNDWRQTAVNGLVGYWLRFRVTAVIGTVVPPSITQVFIDAGNQYAVFAATQGESQADDPLGSSTGLPDQAFSLFQGPVIDDATLRVFVTEDLEAEWTRVPDFLASTPIDRHFTVTFDDNGYATIHFGDGTFGKIPASGYNNIRALYRTMDDVDGNVGQNTITVNRSGVPFINNVTNPRAASGYTIKEGSTPADLARVKVAGPASLRTRERAVTPEDVEELAKRFVASDGSKPVARALAIEEAYGPKDRRSGGRRLGRRDAHDRAARRGWRLLQRQQNDGRQRQAAPQPPGGGDQLLAAHRRRDGDGLGRQPHRDPDGPHGAALPGRARR